MADDVTRDETGEEEYASHLERSRRQWDRWSDWYSLSERDFEPMREAAIARLELEQGDAVLEVGCGPGVNLEQLAKAVGPTGRVVAVDYSPAMLERARERVETHGLDQVELVRADATTADLGGPYDAAVATLALSVMPDVRRTVENVHRVLTPEGQLAVVDIRPFPTGARRVMNPLVRRFLRWYANWNSEGDVLESLESCFEICAVVETHLGGAVYTALASR